ncbi:MAG: flippase-like domain-containing protein, partial [Planctomycetales bacterium]|nr:flippase-like domain-containing protein [Planctomycetales bacterium]
FLCDAATLCVLLFAMAADCHPLIVFASFVAASVVAMIGLVPGGLGTFEGTCVAMLHVHGVSLEAALACTLLSRGFTFWLPMLPGLWLTRRELT